MKGFLISSRSRKNSLNRRRDKSSDPRKYTEWNQTGAKVHLHAAFIMHAWYVLQQLLVWIPTPKSRNDDDMWKDRVAGETWDTATARDKQRWPVWCCKNSWALHELGAHSIPRFIPWKWREKNTSETNAQWVRENSVSGVSRHCRVNAGQSACPSTTRRSPALYPVTDRPRASSDEAVSVSAAVSGHRQTECWQTIAMGVSFAAVWCRQRVFTSKISR